MTSEDIKTQERKRKKGEKKERKKEEKKSMHFKGTDEQRRSKLIKTRLQEQARARPSEQN